MKKCCTILFALLAWLGACDVERKPDQTATPSDSALSGIPIVGSSDAVIGRWRALVPDSVFLRRGACPFECCVYGEWALRDSAAVFTTPQTPSPVAFVLPDSTRFKADSGFVRITQLQLLAISDTVDQRPVVRFLPGDTVVVLDYVGEGHWNVWHEGRVYQVNGFWGAEVVPLVASLVGSYERQWWTHITTTDGRKGWLLIQPPMQVIGADKCGGPPYWVKDSLPGENP